jgi:hypothetical protein
MKPLTLAALLVISLGLLLARASAETDSARMSPSENLAQDRPAFCSSIENTCNLCWNAVDGKPDTRWSSQFSDPQWIYVDLGVPMRIEQVVLHWEAAYGKTYQIQTSNDISTWTEIYSTTTGDGGVDNLAVSGFGRYVRMVSMQRATEWGHSLWEFEVYGVPGTVFLPMAMSRFSRPTVTPTPTPSPTPAPISIPVDDFGPPPYPGAAFYPFNRLDGDVAPVNNSILTWGQGQLTTTVATDQVWGGASLSLNHKRDERLPINFSAVLPAQILPQHQSAITGLTVHIARGTPDRTLRMELKDRGKLGWSRQIALTGGEQVADFDLLAGPPAVGDFNELLWVLDRAAGGDNVVLDSIAFTATTRVADTATAAFVWSYGMLLNNWDPNTGLVRDKAKDASGEFDAIQVSGSLAAATAQANQLGIISRADAIQIVSTISDTLLLDVPRFHGLLPHFVKISPTGIITPAKPDVEYSSIDTVIAAVGLLAAQNALGLDTSGAERLLQEIDWNGLTGPEGMISMGYGQDGKRIEIYWDIFGGESWLVGLAHASATGRVAHIRYPSPPTANGAGFIDELAWLFVPPPAGRDYWNTDWISYRQTAADKQIRYYPSNYPTSCFARLGLFGLSSAEVPNPSQVASGSIYQAFGVGGRDPCANDGSSPPGAPVVVPHYAGLIASLRPGEATRMWDWLIEKSLITPLNNVESLMFPPGAACDCANVVRNQMKGSWNLALQTLGWGRYLAERRGQVPVLWQAAMANAFLREGYLLLAPNGPAPTSTP